MSEQRPPITFNTPKLIVAIVAMICVTTLAILNRVSGDSAMYTIGLILAYILGNGVATLQGKRVEPIIGTTTQFPANGG